MRRVGRPVQLPHGQRDRRDAALGRRRVRPGSRLILTYVDAAALRPADHPAPWIAAVDRAGEPFVTGLDPSAAEEFFAARGLQLLADASTPELAERFGLRAASTIPGLYRVA